MKRLRKGKKFYLSLLVLFLIVGLILICISFLFMKNRNTSEKNTIIDYTKYYSKYVQIKGEQVLYKLVDNKYIEKGKIYNGVIIELEELKNANSEYFQVKNMDSQYYIKYNAFDKYDDVKTTSDRYKNYIPFNENIVTKEEFALYNDKGNKVYTINDIANFPIIIKDDDKYYVEYDNMLLYILDDDVDRIIETINTDVANTKGIPILNYHFVYNPDEETCNQEICHTEEQFRMHLSYIKDNEYFTPTMYELEQYIDGKIQLPKSVVITIDDGRNVNLAVKLLEEYKLNATAFIVTSRYDVENAFVKSNYVELQSHSHNLHNVGTCPSGHGQGGGLTCLTDDEILNDLTTSRKLLNNATAFCYPFYEYNSHSIELLKEAGYTMAFAGEYTGGKTKAEVGIDKFRIPRWVIVNYTTMEDFINYVSGKV